MRKLRPGLFKYLLKSRSKRVAESGPIPAHFSLLKRELGGLAWERSYISQVTQSSSCTAPAPMTDSRLGAGLLNNSFPFRSEAAWQRLCAPALSSTSRGHQTLIVPGFQESIRGRYGMGLELFASCS